MSKSLWCRFSRPLAVLVTGALLSGCGGEEKIPLKKVEVMYDFPKNEKPDKAPKNRSGSSKGITRDPSGVNRGN
jgi:hypothetical protein